MQFIRKLDMVNIEHDNQVIVFNVRSYKQTKFSNNLTVFDEINRYLATIPDNRQSAIFNCYTEIHETLRLAKTLDKELRNKLTGKINNLANYVDLEQLDRWLRFNGCVRIPPTADDKLSDDLEERRTFLAEDYRHLGAFTVSLRCMLPIWGEFQDFVSSINRAAAKTKEFESLRLITTSAFYTHVSVARVRTYIEATVESVGGSTSALVSGLGTSLLPDHLLAGAVVRRLAVAPLNEDLDRGGLAKNIHGYVQSALKDFDNPQDCARIVNGGGGDSETGEDFSKIDGFRVKGLIPPGGLEKYVVWLDLVGPQGVAKSIDPTIPPDLVQACCEANANLEYIDLEKCQRLLAKWVMDSVIPCTMLDTIKRKQISTIVMPAVQALLIHWGFDDMAILVTAEKSQEPPPPSFTSYIRITKQTNKLLGEMYPYSNAKPNKNDRQQNVGYSSIEGCAQAFNCHQWNVNIPDIILPKFSGIRARSSISTPSDISERLALIVDKIWSVRDGHAKQPLW